MIDALNPNFRDLLNCFNSARVRYLLIGGYAVNFYGYHRSTKDIDVWIAVDPQNAESVVEALRKFGFTQRSVQPELFLNLGTVHSFGREPFRVDILTSISGAEFEQCYARRIEGDLDGIIVPIISLADLKSNKLASGRTRDLADAENLPEKRKKTSRRKKR